MLSEGAVQRTVAGVVTAHQQIEGGGFPVRRPLPTAGCPALDPFLLIDEMGPVHWPPGAAIGAPDHPHRGFETVTYVLAGEVQHKDSHGNVGRLGPGDVQWMTAGAGIVHSELPSPAFKAQGGLMHGFQVWVNLPAADKMMRPRYQELPSAEIPRGCSEDGLAEVAVIAGQALGVNAAIDTVIPIIYQHWTLQPGARVLQPVVAEHNAVTHVFAGVARVAGTLLNSGQMGVLGAGDAVLMEVDADAADAAQLLLLAGRPIAEPVARYGPFVMNTEQELVQAFRDFEAGRMGEIPPER